MSVIDCHSKEHASLNDEQKIDYPDPLELLLRDPRPFNPSSVVSRRQADTGKCSRSRLYIPNAELTTRDRDLGIGVCLALFGATPILFVYAVIKLFE